MSASAVADENIQRRARVSEAHGELQVFEFRIIHVANQSVQAPEMVVEAWPMRSCLGPVGQTSSVEGYPCGIDLIDEQR